MITTKHIGRIYKTQRVLGIQDARLRHVEQVARNLGELRAGNNTAFYDALSPENRGYEDRRAYLCHIDWLRSLIAPFSSEELTSLEVGAHLHDIGYARSAGPDHPQVGYELLTSPEGQKFMGDLELPTSVDRGLVAQIARYHGFFTDVGFLFPPEMAGTFPSAEKSALAVMSALDSSAKPTKEGFHSMLFSRMLERYRTIFDHCSLPSESRIQQLFGPINFLWLNDRDLDSMLETLRKEGVLDSPEFHTLLGNGIFHCWPMLKDLVTPEIAFTTSYYTPFDPNKAMYFARLMMVLSRLANIQSLKDAVVFDLPKTYTDFANRPKFLHRVEMALARPIEEDPKMIGDSTFCYREGIFLTTSSNQDGSKKIIIDVEE